MCIFIEFIPSFIIILRKEKKVKLTGRKFSELVYFYIVADVKSIRFRKNEIVPSPSFFISLNGFHKIYKIKIK